MLSMYAGLLHCVHRWGITEFYTLSLHDALPISPVRSDPFDGRPASQAPCRGLRRSTRVRPVPGLSGRRAGGGRSEEHTSELQSHSELVCRLVLEKKKD